MLPSQLAEYRSSSSAATTGDGVESVVVPLMTSAPWVAAADHAVVVASTPSAMRACSDDKSVSALTHEFVITTPGVGAVKFHNNGLWNKPQNVVVCPELA